MGYKLISVKCPDCGQTLAIEEGRTQAFCSYCGSKILISNENEYIFRQVDEADVKRAETDRIIRMHELQIDEKNSSFRKTLTVVWIILSMILILIAVILMLSPGSKNTPGWAKGVIFLFFVCGPIIGGGGHLVFKWIPEKENERNIERQGGIRFPKGLAPYTEKKYYAIEDALRSAGFTNISCVNLHDLNFLTSLFSADKISQITIKGEQVTSGGKIYMPDVPVIITYHGR